jgi:hypothetical protein
VSIALLPRCRRGGSLRKAGVTGWSLVWWSAGLVVSHHLFNAMLLHGVAGNHPERVGRVLSGPDSTVPEPAVATR